ncbi:MAG: hypothetical protein KJ571_08290 [Bacteroidetes bacterium]|nr:hypothetical protein [Bacteroidota bacterium]
MSSFSCQFIDLKNDHCIRLKQTCVPGRNGCVLNGRFVFAVPAESRINENLKIKNDSIRKHKKDKK